MTRLEVCCGDLASARAAALAGAWRIELCTGLSADGLTPSAGLMSAARRTTEGRCRMNVLIRPDENPGFVMDGSTRQVVLDDIAAAARAGADGVVIGALRPDRSIDTEFVASAVARAHELGLIVTFHRAFDITANPHEALGQLIDLGVDCVLTSGQQPAAEQGSRLLRELVEQSRGRIDIMPGAGVRPANIASIVAATGCTVIHSSCRKPGAASSDTETISQCLRALQ